MGEPIQIIVTAQAAQAAAVLRNFALNGAKELNLLTQDGVKSFLATKEGLEGSAASAIKATSAMYSLRSSIDAIRFAAAGGGFRALFYAADEATRALVASGVAMSTMLPVIGEIALAIGAGVLAWHEWNAATDEVAEKTKKLAENFKELPPLLKQIADLQKVGLLSPEAAEKYNQMLTHPGDYFVDENGQITTQKTHKESALMSTQIPLAKFLAWTGDKDAQKDLEETIDVPNKQATPEQMFKSVMDQATGGGSITATQVASLLGLQDIDKKIDEAVMTPAEKSVAEIKDRFQKMRDELQQQLGIAGAKMPSDEKKSFSDWLLGINPIDIGNIGALSAAQIKTQQDKMVEINQGESQAIAAITAKADAERAKTFDEWVKKQGDAFIETLKQNQKKLEDEKKLTEEKNRQLELEQEIARLDIENKIKAIEGNPQLSKDQKAQQSIPLYGQLTALDAQRSGQLQSIANDPQTKTDARLEAEKQLEEVLNQQVETQNKLNEAAGQTSFAFQFGVQLAAIQNEFGTWAIQFGNTFKQLADTLRSSITSNISGWIERTKSWGTAMRDIAKSVMDDVIQSFVSMGVRWATTQLTMTASSAEGASRRNLIVAGETIWHGLNVAARTAAHIAGEILMTAVSVAQSAIRIGVIIAETIASLIKAAIEAMAAMASIPYVGPVLAVAAMAAILAAGYGVIEGFESGGYTGDGARGEVAGVVHRGEFVVPAHVVDRVGLGNLTAMTSGAQSRGGGGAAGSQRGSRINTNVNIAQFDGKSDAQRWADSQEGEVWFHSKLDKHVQRYTKKS